MSGKENQGTGNMLDKKEIKVLVALLDDSDEEVVRHVTNKLKSYGSDIIPLLDGLSTPELNELQVERITGIKKDIRLAGISEMLESWAKGGAKDLWEGALIASRYGDPFLDKEKVDRQLDQLKLDTWLELNPHLTPLEKVRKINYVIYKYYGYKGDEEDYHNPNNSYINKVLENKKGNPISLAIVYSVICQRLGIPVFGVNLPQHFVLAYKDDREYPRSTPFKSFQYLEPGESGNILFYINAFNKGTIFNRWNIDQFLRQLKLPSNRFYCEPCSNVDIIMRVFRNLTYSYEKRKKNRKSREVKMLLVTLEPYSSLKS